MTRARILIVTPSLGGGGAEHHLVRVLPALVGSFEVHLATLKDNDTLAADVPPEVTRHRIGSGRWLTAACRLRALSKRLRPALHFAVQDAASIPLLLARAGLRARERPPVVISVQTSLSAVLVRSRPRTRFLVREAVRRLYPGATVIISATHGVARELNSIAPAIDKARFAIIPNASVPDAIRQRAAEPCAHPFFTDDDGPVLVACGRLMDAKDYPTMLRALAALRSHQHARLIILGDGPDSAELHALAGELGISDVVSFAGYVNNPYVYFSRASLFVLSSRWEGFGNVIAEALGCGAAVVSTNCPFGPAEILGDGEFGVLVPMGDPAALANAIAALLNDPIRRNALMAKAPARAEQFTVARSGRAHVELFSQLISKNA